MPAFATKTAALAAAVALFALACRQTIHSQVSTFTQLSEPQHDATYAIMPLKDQRNSREFKAFSRRVGAHLEANGFVPRPLDRAEFIVAMAYANDDGSDALSAYPIIGQTGASSSRMAGTSEAYRNTTSYAAGAKRGSTGGAASDSDTPPASDLPRVLRLDIVRRDSIGFGDLEKVYEGEVVSTGSDDELTEIVPVMIEALFQKFPGKDGEVRHVETKSVPSLEEFGTATPSGNCPSNSDCARERPPGSASLSDD